ncbi:MAG: polysaccharide deacetylase family protein [Bacteroidetes bacterium]|nr:MAG: polysaccharide deacetylase family protein [Bacteroidota bacterium]
MNLTPVTIPKIVKTMFPDFIWDIKTREKTLYLTFDDGPTPEITEWVLDCLKKHDAKATFFCIGKNVKLFPEIYNRIIDEEHGVGNHTFNHLKGWKTKTPDYLYDAHNASVEIKSKLFRPPYGRIKPKQAKSLLKDNYKIIMWSILSLDWDKNISASKCYHNVVDKATSGSIIVFHDSKKASHNMMYALPKVLDYFSKKGYDFKRILE